MLLNRLPLHMLPTRAVLLAADVVLLALPEGERAEARFLSRTEPPYGTVEVLSLAGLGRIAAIRMDPKLLDEEQLTVPYGDGDDLDCLMPIVLGSDVIELAEDLDLSSRRRLLAFLLGFCRKAFDLGTNTDFSAACNRLGQLCIPDAGQAEPAATITPLWTLLSLPTLSADASVYIVRPTKTWPSAAISVEGHPRLRLTEPVVAGDLIIALGDHPARWVVAKATTGLQDLMRPHRSEDGLRAACLRALAPACPTVSAMIREQVLLAPAAPIRHDDRGRPIGAALEAALPDGAGGIFLRGWLRDPLGLVRSAELAGPTGTIQIEWDQLHRFRRPDVEKHFNDTSFADTGGQPGFVAHLADPSDGLSLQPTLLLRLHSGARIAVRPPMRHLTPAASRAAVLTSVLPEDVTDDMLDDCLGPAAAAFHRRSLADRPDPERIQIGAQRANPAVSIIVPLYRTLSFLRFQIAALAADAEIRSTELIFVLDSPEQRHEVEHLLRGLNAMYDVSFLLLVMPRNMGYAAANNAGVAYARAAELLLLNSDVVPATPGFLSKLRTALASPGIGAVGPKLLFDDESIQHAGLYFQPDAEGVWLNAHYHKGMPRLWPAAADARRVPGVTGAALLVRKALFERLGGICEDYIIGDYEDSDFCLKIQDAGLSIAYEPAAELFHFERRSIGLHKGYTGTIACRYNRRLHHRRWNHAITDLMARPEHRSSAYAAAA